MSRDCLAEQCAGIAERNITKPTKQTKKSAAQLNIVTISVPNG